MSSIFFIYSSDGGALFLLNTTSVFFLLRAHALLSVPNLY